MAELTPELAARLLDKLGPPRHLEPRREVSLNECRRFLEADGGFPARLDSVARHTGVDRGIINCVVREFLRLTPSGNLLSSAPHGKP
jgi:hypothetical protein